MRKLVPVALLVFALLPSSAFAGKWYIGATVGEASLEARSQNARFDVDDTAYKAYVGFKALRWLGIEGGYTDLGNFRQTVMQDIDGDGNPDTVALDASAETFTLFANGILSVSPRLELYAKVGAAGWDTELNVDDGVNPVRDTGDGVDFAYGFGLNYRIVPSFSLRLEWEKFDFDNTDDVAVTALGAQFNF